MVGGLYNVFWGKSIEERDDLTKISAAAAGKPGLDDDDGAEAKV